MHALKCFVIPYKSKCELIRLFSLLLFSGQVESLTLQAQMRIWDSEAVVCLNIREKVFHMR